MIVAVGVEIPVPEPTQNNSTSEKDDGDELNPMFIVIGAIALIGAGGAAYFYTRDTTDYSAIRTSTVEEKRQETGRKKVLKSFEQNAKLVSIECPGCDAQMKVPKLNELQEVTSSACGLTGEIEI